jgi:hypothetical protein
LARFEGLEAADVLDLFVVRPQRFDPAQERMGDGNAARARHPCKTRVALNRQDSGQNGASDPDRPASFHELLECVRVVKELRDDEVGPGFDLVFEMYQLFVRQAAVSVCFGAVLAAECAIVHGR